MPTIAPEAEVSEDLLLSLDFQPGIPCDWNNCFNTAIGFLICAHCGVGMEAECKEHHEASLAQELRLPGWRIRFSNTCGHNPEYAACRWDPIGI